MTLLTTVRVRLPYDFYEQLPYYLRRKSTKLGTVTIPRRSSCEEESLEGQGHGHRFSDARATKHFTNRKTFDRSCKLGS